MANTADGSASPAKLVEWVSNLRRKGMGGKPLISDASLATIKLKPSVVRTSNDVSKREKCQIASFSTSYSGFNSPQLFRDNLPKLIHKIDPARALQVSRWVGHGPSAVLCQQALCISLRQSRLHMGGHIHLSSKQFFCGGQLARLKRLLERQIPTTRKRTSEALCMRPS